MNGFSPYGSPTTSEDRGRSPQRFPNHKAPVNSSPRAHISSPLARVAEELPDKAQGLRIDTGLTSPPASKAEKLVSIDSPLPPQSATEEKRDSLPKSRLSTMESNEDENTTPKATTAENAATAGGAEEMKNVEI